MMTETYFPVEVNLMSDENINSLLNEMNAEGVGIYFGLLMEMRKQKEYMIGKHTVVQMARVYSCPVEKVMQVLSDYDLFETTEKEGKTWYFSPYMDRVMSGYEQKKKRLSDAGKKSGQVRKAKALKPGSNHLSTKEKKREEKKREEKKEEVVIFNNNKEENSSVAAAVAIPLETASGEAPLWERYIDEAMREQSWVELQGMHSGMGLTFMRRLPEIVDLFKEHVRIQGTESTILSLRDAKSYFSNFTRQSSKTMQRLKERLDRTAGEEDPYRFESVDPITGKRTCFGHEIPEYAPPRPNSYSCWDDVIKAWC